LQRGTPIGTILFDVGSRQGTLWPTSTTALIRSRIVPDGDAMAKHDQLEYATATGNDYPAHEEMYRRFLTLTMSAIAIVTVLLIIMAIFLT